jgi:hypothetical protein
MPITVSSIGDQIKKMASGEAKTPEPMLTWSQWNYYLERIVGSPGPVSSQYGVTNEPAKLSFEEWWGYVSSSVAGGAWYTGGGRLVGPGAAAEQQAVNVALGGGSTPTSPSIPNSGASSATVAKSGFLDSIFGLIGWIFGGSAA